MSLCVVSGTIKDGSETGVSGVVVQARPLNPYLSGSTLIVPKLLETTSDSNGLWQLSLNQGGQFILTVMYPPNVVDSARRYNYSIIIPAASTANFSDLVTED